MATGAATAFLTVQEGCDKFCTFCVVPYTRGAEYSRPVARRPARGAASMPSEACARSPCSARTSTATTARRRDGQEWRLGRLIRAIAEIEGIDRIRYTTSYPADHDDDLIRAHAEVPQLMPYLHLPVQSGSDRILRGDEPPASAPTTTAASSIGCAAARPDLALSSDFIVGFPGETDEDFDATLRLVEEVGFAQAYSFKYSPRPGTPAAAAEPQVPASGEGTSGWRISRNCSNDSNERSTMPVVGRELPILLERPGRNPGQLVGRSPYMQAVHVRRTRGAERATSWLCASIASARTASPGRSCWRIAVERHRRRRRCGADEAAAGS